MSDKKEIANLFNSYFTRIADCAAQISEAEYKQDYANHPSILSIHEHNSHSYFEFQPTNQVLVEKFLLDIINK